MRVGYLSSHPPIECGIAAYMSHLDQAVHDLDLETFVVAPNGARGDRVFAAFAPAGSDFAPSVGQMFLQLSADLVHIQHDFGLYGSSRGIEALDLVLRLRMAEMPVVVTLHSIGETLDAAETMVLSHMLPECQAIIVHESYQRDTLAEAFGPDLADKVSVIDHGIREVERVHGAKRKLDLHSNKVVLMAGCMHPDRGLVKAVDFFDKVAKAHPDALLVVAAKAVDAEMNRYRRQVLAALADAPFAKKVQIFNGQFPDHTFDTLMSAADVVVLPDERGVQSEVLSQAIAFKRPVVASDLKAFQGVTRRSGAGVSCPDDELGDQIIRILDSRDVATAFAGAADTYIRRRAGWSVVARRHRDLYRRVLHELDHPGRYVFVPGQTEPATPAAVAKSGDKSSHTQAISEWLKTAENFDQPTAPKPRTLAELEFVD